MRTGHLLFSAVQFVFTALVILLGVFCIGLENAQQMRLWLSHFFLDTSTPFALIGYAILGCGLLLFIGFYVMNQTAYFQIKMGKKHVLLDGALFQKYIAQYWFEKFSQKSLEVQAIIRSDQKLEILAQLPQVFTEEREALLEKVEEDLTEILRRKLGYRGEFLLNVILK